MELMKKHVDLDSLETLYEMTFEEAALQSVAQAAEQWLGQNQPE